MNPGRLKVALLSSGLGQVLRGIEVWMLELAQQLPPSAVDVRLWGGGVLPGAPENFSSLRGWSREAPVFRRWSWHRRYIFEQWSVLPAAALRLKEQAVDLVYCGDPVLSWHLKRLRRWHGAKVVFLNGMRLSPGWARGFDGVHLLAPPYLAAARAELGEAAATPFFAVPHFVDGGRFQPATSAERTAARRRWGLGDDDFVVLNLGPVGRSSGKRLAWLATELAPLAAPVKLLHAGGEEDGAEAVRAEVLQALGPRARLLGPVPRADVLSLYHAADAYALGSLAEPFSIAILEALASGLPVVHHPDEVMTWQCGPGGVPVSMTEPGAAGAALDRLVSRPADRLALGRAARHLAETRYAPATICAELLAAWQACVRRTAVPA